MLNRFVACLLSLTLVFNSFVPTFAYAVGEGETETEQALSEEEVVTDVYGGFYSVHGSGYDQFSSGLSDGEEPEEIERNSLTPEELDAQIEQITATPSGKTRAVPVVVAWLASTIGSTVIGYAITELISGDDEDDPAVQTVALLYGIQAALVDGNGNSVFSLLNRVTNYLSNTYYLLDDVFDALYPLEGLLEDVYDAFFYKVDGTTYSLAGDLHRIREWMVYTDANGKSYSLAGLLANLVYYTTGGTTYSLAGDVHRIREWLVYTDANGKSYALADLLGNLVYYTTGGTTYSLAGDVHRIREFLVFTDADGKGYSAGNLLYLVWQALENFDVTLDGEDINVEVPEVNVDVDVQDELASKTDLWLLLFGALEFAMIASSLDDLGDTLENTFPFCLIPAFVALIGLLQADPVAPCFDFPLPDGSGGTFVYTVDLSVFDPVAQAFRVLMTITYCIGLIFLTRNFIFKGGAND